MSPTFGRARKSSASRSPLVVWNRVVRPCPTGRAESGLESIRRAFLQRDLAVDTRLTSLGGHPPTNSIAQLCIMAASRLDSRGRIGQEWPVRRNEVSQN